VGIAHPTAEYIHRLIELGVYNFRLEFVNETPEEVSQTIGYYQQLLGGQISGAELWQELKLINHLGVTRGSLGVRSIDFRPVYGKQVIIFPR
jgi:U32 family peptidase